MVLPTAASHGSDVRVMVAEELAKMGSSGEAMFPISDDRLGTLVEP